MRWAGLSHPGFPTYVSVFFLLFSFKHRENPNIVQEFIERET